MFWIASFEFIRGEEGGTLATLLKALSRKSLSKVGVVMTLLLSICIRRSSIFNVHVYMLNINGHSEKHLIFY